MKTKHVIGYMTVCIAVAVLAKHLAFHAQLHSVEEPIFFCTTIGLWLAYMILVLWDIKNPMRMTRVIPALLCSGAAFIFSTVQMGLARHDGQSNVVLGCMMATLVSLTMGHHCRLMWERREEPITAS